MRSLLLARALGVVDLYEAVPGQSETSLRAGRLGPHPSQTCPHPSQAALGAGRLGPHPTAAGTASASAAA